MEDGVGGNESLCLGVWPLKSLWALLQQTAHLASGCAGASWVGSCAGGGALWGESEAGKG